MKKLILLSLIMFVSFVSFDASAQTTGDYRSNATTFNWSTDNSWQRWDGDSWEVPTGAQGYPGETAASIAGTVTIQNGHTVTINVSPPQNIGNLMLLGNGIATYNGSYTVNASGTLTMDGTSQILGTSSNRRLNVLVATPGTGNFSVPISATDARISGVTVVINGPTNVAGVFRITSDTGTKTFTGRVTVTGTWNSAAVTTNDRLVFKSEVLTSGIYIPGCN